MDKKQNLTRIVVTIETRIYREGITQLLDNYADFEVISATSNVAETFELCSTVSPQILLLDATLPDSLSSIRRIREDFPDIKIILMSMQACRNEMARFAGEGVQEFVTREDSIDDLYQTIRAAMKNGFWCSSRVAKILLNQELTPPQMTNLPTDSPLTRQQVNVLELLESGISNKEIARRLHIETATVKNHVHNILQKLQVNSRGEAAAVFRRLYDNYTAV